MLRGPPDRDPPTISLAYSSSDRRRPAPPGDQAPRRRSPPSLLLQPPASAPPPGHPPPASASRPLLPALLQAPVSRAPAAGQHLLYSGVPPRDPPPGRASSHAIVPPDVLAIHSSPGRASCATAGEQITPRGLHRRQLVPALCLAGCSSQLFVLPAARPGSPSCRHLVPALRLASNADSSS